MMKHLIASCECLCRHQHTKRQVPSFHRSQLLLRTLQPLCCSNNQPTCCSTQVIKKTAPWQCTCRHQHTKRQIPTFCRSQLLLRTFTGWKAVTTAKLQKEQQRRKAVRHHYLSLLARGVAAWQQAMQLADEKQGMLQRAAQQRDRQLQLRALQVGLSAVILYTAASCSACAFHVIHASGQGL
jgi:hypothetical protein